MGSALHRHRHRSLRDLRHRHRQHPRVIGLDEIDAHGMEGARILQRMHGGQHGDAGLMQAGHIFRYAEFGLQRDEAGAAGATRPRRDR